MSAEEVEIERVKRAVQAFRDAVELRDADALASALYCPDAELVTDDGSPGARRGETEIAAYFRSLLNGAVHASASFGTEPSGAAIRSSGEGSLTFSGRYKISVIRSFEIVELHADFAFVYDSSTPGELLRIKHHTSTLTPKGRVVARGYFNKLEALLERKDAGTLRS